MNEIASQYNPKETEDKWYKFWEDSNLFSAKPNPAKKPFCIVIPPPNVTGILHMGHALNNTIQDILIRYHRMLGEESLWMPGTDHAGIATQNVVEKAIAKEGLTRQDLGRDKFVDRVQQWKEQYGLTIIHQLKKLGASCDWPRTRFTMDNEYSKAVIEVFVRLYEKGLIERENYIINWCPRCRTALSDEEAPHHEIQGYLYYIKYPFKDIVDEFMVVATTRPETMLGDTAVAVNPKDKRYNKYIGKTLILPLVNREIKVIADNSVDMKFGTGAVKVTPAHDRNDYKIGKKHNLKFINIMYYDGTMNYEAGDYANMDRFEARQAIIEDLKEKGLLARNPEPHKHAVSHCYRCHTIIEPYLSWQWFVKMQSLAKPAIDVVKKGKIKFHPKRWTKVYLNWMENIQDWCISRQIWWGHQIPVWYCNDCNKGKIIESKSGPSTKNLYEELTPIVLNPKPIVGRVAPEKCPDCGSSNLRQDPDVLDTWFSSWLWPFATFYWPKESEDLKYFYPTSVLVTAPEIIFFWVARMIMAGLEFMKDIPFRDVYIHGTVRDIEGKKMSKSLGNIIDPLEIINEYGADALRFSLISITAQGQDVFLSKERFQQGRNFANKIWNASRFILMNLDSSGVNVDLCVFFQKENLDIVNRWILSRFYSVLKELNLHLENYKFNEAANALYGFFWHEFCDWYLELIKPDIKNASNQIVMYKVLEKSLRILHPFMPFITEEIWQRLNETTSIMIQPWPHVQEQIIDAKLERQAQCIFDCIAWIRNLRSLIEVKPEQKVKVSLFVHHKPKLDLLKDNAGLITHLARLESLEFLDANKKPKETISQVAKDVDIYLHFSGIMDLAGEKQKTKLKLINLSKVKTQKEARLKNKEFLKKAPVEVVEKEKESVTQINDELRRLEKMLNELGA